MKKILLAVLLIFIFAISTGLAYGETKMYLHLSSIDGESESNDYLGWIDITAWSWDINNSSEDLSHPGAKSATPDVGPIYVQKYVDLASPFLFYNALTGAFIAEAIIALVIEDYYEGLDHEIVKITMNNVRIINIHSGDESSDGIPMESVAMDFSKVCYTYSVEPSDAITRCWDIDERKK